jgi:hypothetical protein
MGGFKTFTHAIVKYRTDHGERGARQSAALAPEEIEASISVTLAMYSERQGAP